MIEIQKLIAMIKAKIERKASDFTRKDHFSLLEQRNFLCLLAHSINSASFKYVQSSCADTG